MIGESPFHSLVLRIEMYEGVGLEGHGGRGRWERCSLEAIVLQSSVLQWPTR